MFSIISLYSSYFTSISYFYLIIMVFTIFRLSIYQVGFSEGGIREWVRLGTWPKVNSNKESYASFQRRTNILESSFPMNRTFEHFNSHDMNVRQVNMSGNFKWSQGIHDWERGHSSEKKWIRVRSKWNLMRFAWGENLLIFPKHLNKT